MANSYSYRTGQREPRKYGVASATVIEIGDLVYYDTSTDQVKPASDFTWNTDLATTQGGFADVVAGVAMESSASG